MTCFDVLGWQHFRFTSSINTRPTLPQRMCCCRATTNAEAAEEGSSVDACRAYGLEGWERIDKGSIAAGHRRTAFGRTTGRLLSSNTARKTCACRPHCFALSSTDMATCRPLTLPACCIGRITAPRWSRESRPPVCRSTCRLWNLVQENKAAVVRELLRRHDPSSGSEDPIYTPEGEWSYVRFENWLVGTGVPAWPRLDSGRLDVSGDAFKLMYHHPGIESLHALRDSLGVIVKAKLPIGPDGRNRPSLFPFCTATGRNAHSRSLYNAHASVRSFMKFPPDKIGAYLDWRTQEVGVAATHVGRSGTDRGISQR